MPPGRDEDAHLCLRAAGGDRRAFGELVARHESRLRAFLSHLAGPELGDEIAQQSFVKAWESVGRFRGESLFSSWLCAIGWRSFIDHVRKEKSEARKREHEGWFEESSGPIGCDARLDLERALGQLEPVERASLILCEGHGWSHVEAAGILGIPLGTLKGAVARAKRKCRTLLEMEAA